MSSRNLAASRLRPIWKGGRSIRLLVAVATTTLLTSAGMTQEQPPQNVILPERPAKSAELRGKVPRDERRNVPPVRNRDDDDAPPSKPRPLPIRRDRVRIEDLDLDHSGFVDQGDWMLLNAHMGEALTEEEIGRSGNRRNQAAAVLYAYDLVPDGVIDARDLRVLEPYLGTDVVATLVTEIVETVNRTGGAMAGTLFARTRADREMHDWESILARSPFYEAFRRIHAALVEIGAPALGRLLALADDENPYTRKVALIALGALGDSVATDKLLSILSNEAESAFVREAAAYGLIVYSNARDAVMPLLIAIVSDKGEYVPFREGMARVLGASGDPEAVRALVSVAGDVDEPASLRITSVEALGLSTADVAVDSLISLLGHGGTDAPFIGLAAETTLKGMLRDRTTAPAVIERLVPAMSSPDTSIALGAWTVLISAGEEAVNPLTDALQDDDPYLRRMAASALGERSDPAAIKALIETLADEDPSVRETARDALVSYQENAVSALRNALMNQESSIEKQERIREGAKSALIRIGGRSTEDALIPLLGFDRKKARTAAAVALGTLASAEAIEPLLRLQKSNPGARSTVVVALAMILSHVDAPGWNDARNRAEKLLVGVGTATVQEIVTIQQDREADPLIKRALTEAGQWLQHREDVRVSLERDGIALRGAFALRGLESVRAVLDALPRDLWRDLKGFRLAEKIPYLSGGESLFLANTNEIMLTSHAQLRPEVIAHELAHLIDQSFFGFRAFDTLHAQSRYTRDYARNYGMESVKEDFATTFQAVVEDTRREVLRAVVQARTGDQGTVYLRKLLYVLDLMSGGIRNGRPTGSATRVFHVDARADGLRWSRIAVERDASGGLRAIGGVTIYDGGGRLNLDGLQAFFGGLDMDDEQSVRPLSSSFPFSAPHSLQQVSVSMPDRWRSPAPDLLPAYPNPANPAAWIPFALAQDADVTITIYNARGETVRVLDLGHLSVGAYTTRARAAHWDGKNAVGERVASGMYFYEIRAGSFRALRTLTVMR